MAAIGDGWATDAWVEASWVTGAWLVGVVAAVISVGAKWKASVARRKKIRRRQ